MRPTVLATAALMLVPLMHPTTAAAHAILVDSAPAPRVTVKAGRLDITLRYNSRIDAARSKLTLTGPDHLATRLDIAASDRPDLLRAGLDLGPGTYVLRWQVLAIDGHITRGQVPFTVSDRAAGNDAIRSSGTAH